MAYRLAKHTLKVQQRFMDAIPFSLLNWSAWAPGLESKEAWTAWANGPNNTLEYVVQQSELNSESRPKLAFIKPMLRRRFSRLTRMALHSCFDCLDGQHTVRTLFCSRHGEIHRTKVLLDDIVKGDPISPMGFSLSVHNTASGLYSIASDNHSASSAIAAGVDTLEMAMIDALGYLQREPNCPVLVVLADEPLPKFYQPYDNENSLPFTLALLLAANPMTEAADEYSIMARPKLPVPAAGNEYPHGLQVLRFLLSNQTHCELAGERLQWIWTKSVNPVCSGYD